MGDFPKNRQKTNDMQKNIDSLIQTAKQMGASDAAIIPSTDIAVEKELAELCGGDIPCENFGLAPSCPPHVSGPAGFKEWQEKSAVSIVVRIDVPTAAMFSDERREIMGLLHEIVAGVEQKAIDLGYDRSKAFAGGSCKDIFCHGHAVCAELTMKGECRNPKSARPSMSGFGINVTRLMQSAGWQAPIASREQASLENSMTWVAGLIVIASSGD